MGIRFRGILILIVASLFFAFVFYVSDDNYLKQTHRTIWSHVANYHLLAATAIALIGFVEAVTGRSFSELSRSWNNLSGWQRGLLGMLITTVCIVMAVVCIRMLSYS